MKEKILLVEDDQEHLSMLELYLSSLGFKIISASGGAEAIDIIKQSSLSIIISDIEMPQINGMGLLNFVKENDVDTDVILVTGYSDQYSITDIIKAGATDFLEKPFTGDALRAKVLRILKERRELERRKKVERILKEKTRESENRLKKLSCLYEISSFIDQNENDLDEIFYGIVRLIPSSFQFPEATHVRIFYKDKQYLSEGFQETPWKLNLPIEFDNSRVGCIEAFQTEDVEDSARGLFLRAEMLFISEIAEKIGHTLYRHFTSVKLQKTAEELRRSRQNLEIEVRKRTKELHDSQAELHSVFQSVPTGIISVDRSMVVLNKNGKCMEGLGVENGQLFQPGESRFQQKCHEVLANTLVKHDPVLDYKLELNKGKENHKVYMLSSSLLVNKTGDLSGAILVIHDRTEYADLENKVLERRQSKRIIGKSQQMQDIFERIRLLASVDTTVLITGESGVGKELLVDNLHKIGDRSSKPLVKVNCSALPENLLESELFGHVRGAFTGAEKDRTGRIQLAEGGVLFLDEIGDISQRLQLKLLRFLESKEYEMVGESQNIKADVRVFAATNANLPDKVAKGLFREDLFYRLKVMGIHIPPLRERREDIPFLIEHFLTVFNAKFNKKIERLSPEVLHILKNYEWRGNVRELKHAMEHAFLLCQGGTINTQHFPQEIISQKGNFINNLQPARSLTRENIISALDHTRWNKTQAARYLRISRATLYNKLKELGID